MNNYEKQANDFLEKHNVELLVKFLKNGKHFADDKDNRDIYEITLKRGQRSYVFNFGQSLANSLKYVDKLNGNEFTSTGGNLKGNKIVTNIKYLKDYCKEVKGIQPNAYDILACLTKYNPGTFEDFCNEFGYDTDSRKAEKTYNAVRDEYLQLISLFNEKEMEQLQEIQ